ncbi:MAG: hypothetical protein EFT35_10410 [Methanophagales archaeon ANME-1-THS]|nr:MAG: hypothetical protein EFT35_10410 [Methanophagales archaeon ANME-1-THS]
MKVIAIAVMLTILIFAGITVVTASESYGRHLTVEGHKTAQKTVAPGANATYTLTVNNRGTMNDSYNLTLTNPNNATTCGLGTDLKRELTTGILTPGESSGITLYVTNLTDGVFPANVTATSVNDSTKFDYVNTTTTVATSAPSGVISAEVIIKPETLNLKSQGVFTAFIILPEGSNVTDIDLSTVICGNATAVRGIAAAHMYIAKFKRHDLDIVPTDTKVTLTVTGNLSDGRAFAGSDEVRVKNGEGIPGKMKDIQKKIADQFSPKPKGENGKAADKDKGDNGKRGGDSKS